MSPGAAWDEQGQKETWRGGPQEKWGPGGGLGAHNNPGAGRGADIAGRGRWREDERGIGPRREPDRLGFSR